MILKKVYLISFFLLLICVLFSNTAIAKELKLSNTNSDTQTNRARILKANDKTMAIIKQKENTSSILLALDIEQTGNMQKSDLAPEPTVPGQITGVTRISTEGFLVTVEKGNGERRMLLMSEEKPCELPIDGKDYSGNFSFGSGDKIGEHTYVVFNNPESQQKRFLIANLKPGTRYYMLLCEANSKGEKINYLIPDTSKFTSYKSTLPEPPKLNEATEIKKGNFKIKWSKVKGALTYFVDVAKDNNFKEILPEFKDLDVGEIEEYLIEGIEGQSKVYCRVRAVGESGQSNDSNVIEVNF